MSFPDDILSSLRNIIMKTDDQMLADSLKSIIGDTPKDIIPEKILSKEHVSDESDDFVKIDNPDHLIKKINHLLVKDFDGDEISLKDLPVKEIPVKEIPTNDLHPMDLNLKGEFAIGDPKTISSCDLSKIVVEEIPFVQKYLADKTGSPLETGSSTGEIRIMKAYSSSRKNADIKEFASKEVSASKCPMSCYDGEEYNPCWSSVTKNNRCERHQGYHECLYMDCYTKTKNDNSFCDSHKECLENLNIIRDEKKNSLLEALDIYHRGCLLLNDHLCGKISDEDLLEKLDFPISFLQFINLIEKVDKFTKEQWNFYFPLTKKNDFDFVAYVSQHPELGSDVYSVIKENIPKNKIFYIHYITAFGLKNKTFFRELLLFVGQSKVMIYMLAIKLLGYEGIILCLRSDKNFDLQKNLIACIDSVSLDDFSSFVDLFFVKHIMDDQIFYEMTTYLIAMNRIDELSILFSKVSNKAWFHENLRSAISHHSIGLEKFISFS